MMFYYKKIPNCNEYFIHLSVDKYTHSTEKKLRESLKKLAKEKNYPKVWTYMPKYKQRIAEHFGFKFLRYQLFKDGVYSFLYMESKDYVS